jgi:hypothetical protein
MQASTGPSPGLPPPHVSDPAARLDRLARSTRDPLNTLAVIVGKKAGFRSLADTWADTNHAARPPDADRVRWPRRVRERVDPRAHQRGTRTRQSARVKLGRKPKLTEHQKREGDSPPRPRRRAGAQDCPQLQRQPQHDFLGEWRRLRKCLTSPIWKTQIRAASRYGHRVRAQFLQPHLP